MRGTDVGARDEEGDDGGVLSCARDEEGDDGGVLNGGGSGGRACESLRDGCIYPRYKASGSTSGEKVSLISARDEKELCESSKFSLPLARPTFSTALRFDVDDADTVSLKARFFGIKSFSLVVPFIFGRLRITVSALNFKLYLQNASAHYKQRYRMSTLLSCIMHTLTC